jgi:CRP-like cAMP-binding protein
MIEIKLPLFVSNFFLSSQGTRTNRRYIVASVQYGTPKIPSAVSAGGVVRESSETRWQENRLLAALPEKERARLIPQLEILTLFAKESIYEAGEEMNYVYFPLDCIVVLISAVESKATVEVGLIGNEGLVGAQILMGAKHSNSQALILTEGKALRLPAAIVRKEAKRSSRLRELMLTYANALLAQSARLAACHRYHTPQARLARVLLMIDDRLQTPELRITQDLLARLLGTRRATITQAANQLQDNKLIESLRGRIRILDRKELEKASCSCYSIITAQQNGEQ